MFLSHMSPTCACIVYVGLGVCDFNFIFWELHSSCKSSIPTTLHALVLQGDGAKFQPFSALHTKCGMINDFSGFRIYMVFPPLLRIKMKCKRGCVWSWLVTFLLMSTKNYVGYTPLNSGDWLKALNWTEVDVISERFRTTNSIVISRANCKSVYCYHQFFMPKNSVGCVW
jgi:hypothetical protein